MTTATHTTTYAISVHEDAILAEPNTDLIFDETKIVAYIEAISSCRAIMAFRNKFMK